VTFTTRDLQVSLASQQLRDVLRLPEWFDGLRLKPIIMEGGALESVQKLLSSWSEVAQLPGGAPFTLPASAGGATPILPKEGLSGISIPGAKVHLAYAVPFPNAKHSAFADVLTGKEWILKKRPLEPRRPSGREQSHGRLS
jgi:hypothetical protein